MPVLNTAHHPENRETTVLLRPKDLHRPSLAGLVVFVAIYFNCLHPGTGSQDVYLHTYNGTQACTGSGWNCWPLPQHLPATTKTFLYQAGANPSEKPAYGCHQPFILCPARLAKHACQQGSTDTDLLRPEPVARLTTAGHGLLRAPVR